MVNGPATGLPIIQDQYENSIFLQVATGNNLLPESTRLAAQRFSFNAEHDLATILDQIASAQAALDLLHAQRREKMIQINIYNSASAPIRKLANEILSYIFILCCRDSFVTPIPLPTQQQYVLGRICAKWRQISLTTPELWSRIHVDHSIHDRANPYPSFKPSILYPAFLQSATRLIQMTGQVPLSLSFINDINNASPIDPFLPEIGRVTEIYVNGCPNTLEAFFILPLGTLSALRCLVIEGSTIKAVWGSHLLHNVHFRKFSCKASIQRADWLDFLPLAQLTCLIIPKSFLTFEELLRVLSIACHLQEGSFSIDRRSEITSKLPSLRNDSQPIELSELHTLSLTIIDGPPSIDLQRIILPRLCHFNIQSGFNFPWNTHWTSLITRSGILETLRIEDHVLSPIETERILYMAPHLKVLELGSGKMFTSSILQKMSTGKLVPELTNLRCLISLTTADEYGALDLHLDMLEARRKGNTGTHVEKVHFLFFDLDEDEALFPGLDRLKLLAQEGWNIIKSMK
ncbi:hypothetical protein H0H93_007849 [Arthromyces matolae]|nr:hypothetical protein H0H93_007849 [Arthromyces matolae]